MAEEKKQKRLFKKKRGGQILTENEVREIRAGRKKLRKEMKKNLIVETVSDGAVTVNTLLIGRATPAALDGSISSTILTAFTQQFSASPTLKQERQTVA